MGRRSPEIDAYIARSPEFARPILVKIREAFHAGCPEIEERLKWGHASFEYKGILGGMAAFKQHVTFGFWKSRLMEDFEHIFTKGPRASAMVTRVESLADLPPKRVLVAYVKEAKRLNDEGLKEPKLARPKRSAKVDVPPDLRSALGKNAAARKTFEAFPPSQKREYVEWITEGKQAATRDKRLRTAIEWMSEGKRRKWKYERKG